MNDKELRELDGWIAEHVMGWTPGHSAWRGVIYFKPSTHSGDAMDVLKKCAEQCEVACHFNIQSGKWRIAQVTSGANGMCETPTLELAICRFAKKLFGPS